MKTFIKSKNIPDIYLKIVKALGIKEDDILRVDHTWSGSNIFYKTACGQSSYHAHYLQEHFYFQKDICEILFGELIPLNNQL